MSRCVAALLLLFVLCAPAEAAAEDYDVTIRRTAHGIPHLEARDWGSAGYGAWNRIGIALRRQPPWRGRVVS